jgi:methyl-accepting chemotaxis protein
MKISLYFKFFILSCIFLGGFCFLTQKTLENNSRIDFFNSRARSIQANKILTSELACLNVQIRDSFRFIYLNRKAADIDPKSKEMYNKIKVRFLDYFHQFVAKGTKYADRDLTLKGESVSKEIISLIDNSLIPLVQKKATDAEINIVLKSLDEKMDFIDHVQHEIDGGVQKALDNSADQIIQIINDSTHITRYLSFGIGTCVILLTVLISYSIVAPLKRTSRNIRSLTQGKYDIALHGLKRRDEIGELNRDMIHLRQSVEKSIRLQCVVDYSPTPLLICDKYLNIIYLNLAAQKAFARIEDKLGYSSNDLFGKSISIFQNANNEHLSFFPENNVFPYVFKCQIGDEWIEGHAYSMPSDTDEFQGAFIGVDIITERILSENSAKKAQEINKLIESASLGDLKQRINTEEFQDFYKDMAHSMNRLMDTISQPIVHVITMLMALSQGDLSQSSLTENTYHGSFNDMNHALKSTIAHLKNFIEKLQYISSILYDSALKTAEGSQNLSKRTEHQACDIEEIASAIEMITASIQHTSHNVNEARQIAQDAAKVAQISNQEMENMTHIMQEIQESSKRISEIIIMIDRITNQTTLLALNASIEAARAGDAGRGFMVVAHKVQALATSSASAAKEIKELIHSSGQRVQKGSSAVHQTLSSIAQISELTQHVESIINTIANASQEQTISIIEIQGAMTRMDDITQQNAQLASQTQSASETMLEKSKEIKKELAFFST